MSDVDTDTALSRRSALRLIAGTAVIAPVVVSEAAPHPAAFPLTHDADLELLELRRAIDAYQSAVRYEMSIPEDTAAHIAAVRESDAREAVVESLVAGIYERTPTSLRDVTLRTEALRQWFFGGYATAIDECHDGPSTALAKLYEAAAIVTGGGHANDA
ncbi:MAG: hypothetical protein K2Z80_12380 [Xanthobacteraceae bacterium]|nr:hypothetical protein [Xanthobacteraceae bacterium]